MDGAVGTVVGTVDGNQALLLVNKVRVFEKNLSFHFYDIINSFHIWKYVMVWEMEE